MKVFVIFLVLIGFVGIVYATHDPDQPYTHSIILPQGIHEKTFEEFMDWCVPFYGEKCTKFYHGTSTLSPIKQIQSGIPFNEIQCKQNLVLIQKYDGSPACVTESTKLKLVEREWTLTNGIHNTAGSSNGHWKLKSEAFVAIPSHELTPINTVNVDEQYSATAILTKPHGMSDQYPSLGYVMYVQVLDPNGDTIAGSWHHGIIKTNQTISAGTYWSPKDTGNYTIEVFAWQSFTGTPHADVSRHTVEVTE